MAENERMTTQLKLRPYQDWPQCDGSVRPKEPRPEFAPIIARGIVTVYLDPIANADFPFSRRCDSPLFWEIAEPWCEKKYVCQHCVEVN